MFISEAYSKLLWILMALGPVLLAVASTPSEARAPARARGEPRAPAAGSLP
jgi:hypothetical protein